MTKRILVTGIGGVVGQGILRNIRACDLDVRIVGTNTEQMSGGNHLCDRVYQMPYAYEAGYAARMQTICQTEQVDLIIPSTDYETYYLALAQKALPCVACSPAKTAKIFLDKYLTWQEFSKNQITFAETSLPQNYTENSFPALIVKPREGRGSRNIHRNPLAPSSFSSEYIVQKMYSGPEITTAFYVTQENQLLGFITLERVLAEGNTIACNVTFDHTIKIEKIIRQMTNAFEIRGSCNIQAIVSPEGDIVPFEVNCRISGTNSIRSQFGFKDVQYTIDEFLYGHTPVTPTITKGSAVRIFMDVIYPETSLSAEKNAQTPHYVF